MAKAIGRGSAPSNKKKPRHTAAQKKAAAKARAATGRPRRGGETSSKPRRFEERSERLDHTRREDDRGYDRPRREDDRGYDRPRREDSRGYDRPRREDSRGYDRPRYGQPRYDRPRFERDDRPARDWREVHAAFNGGVAEEGQDQRSRAPRREDTRRPDTRRPDTRRDETRRDDSRRPAYRDETPRTRTAPAVSEEPYQVPATRKAPVNLGAGNFADLGLDTRLVERLTQLGITAPFPIQAVTIPDALAGRDVLGRGQTGSGKTMAFGLPTLHRLAASGHARAHRPRAVIMTPTRELAMQIVDSLGPLMRSVGLSFQLVAGGMSYTPQLRSLEQGVDVLVATPGRLMDLIERGAADLSEVEVTVLDEADHMSEMGFLEAITAILDLTPADGQRLLFSATLDHGVDQVAKTYLTDPVTHSTDDGTASVTTMDHHVFLVHPHHKRVLTAMIANRPGRTLVFVRTKLGADRVAEQLRESGVFAAALHGGLNQSARTRVLEAYKAGELPVLVATDVAARGIHVDEISLVLQADPPADHKDYLHRSGRTARAGEAGMVVTLALPHQRRKMIQLLSTAGVESTPQAVAPEDDAVVVTAGGRLPDAPPVPQSQLDDLLRPRRRQFGHGQGGRRQGGPRGGHGGRGGRGGYAGGGGRRDRAPGGRGHGRDDGRAGDGRGQGPRRDRQSAAGSRSERW